MPLNVDILYALHTLILLYVTRINSVVLFCSVPLESRYHTDNTVMCYVYNKSRDGDENCIQKM